tara:strand:+ start:3464 stop:4480 length:1017 start_codon:yes stop_codon:yes gene_type:complete
MGFKRLDAEDFVVSADSVQSTAWSTGLPKLREFFTSSVQAAGTSGNYYLSVYQTGSALSNAAVQFDITYGNKTGSGSAYFNASIPRLTPASSIYGQYRTLVLEDENTDFTYGDGTNTFSPNDFWALSIDRARYKEKMYPGTFNLALSGSGGIKKLYLTDSSNSETVATFLGSNRVYQVISGSNGVPHGTSGYVDASGSYGLFLPDIGTILLNPSALSQSIGLESTKTADLPNGTNQALFYNSLVLGDSFQLNSQETITSDYVFVRSRNSEFNYSENPSFISGSTGEVIYDQFINNPQVYITTVGMYNDANELIAVAKLSRPLLKDFTKESLIRVKLDF